MNNAQKTLYGLNKDGSFKVWTIATQGNIILITHGKEGGKMQVKEELVYGKNIGKANETSDSQQANLEAQSRIKKQKDKGYRETKEELDDLPLAIMKASDYDEVGHLITYPAYASPKLDGMWTMVRKINNEVHFFSRSNEEYYIQPLKEKYQLMVDEDESFTAEIYNHGLDLEDISSAVKKHNENTCTLDIYIFDVVESNDLGVDQNTPFKERYRALNTLDQDFNVIEHVIVRSHEEFLEYHDKCVANGYEGAMVKNIHGVYESGKRSNNVQKKKNMKDAEARIIGVTIDRNGNGVFLVQNPYGDNTFNVTYGDFEERQKQAKHPELYIGRYLKYEYQKLYRKTKLPQFPVGKCFRDTKDMDK